MLRLEFGQPCLVNQADLNQIPQVSSIFVSKRVEFHSDQCFKRQDSKIASGNGITDIGGWAGMIR